MRNKYVVLGDIVKIELNRDNGEKHYAKVSVCDLDRLLEFDVTWCLLDQNANTNYVVANEYLGNRKARTVRLHRYITQAQKGLVVNHINGEGLDNTRNNLEVVTNQVNTIKRVNMNSNNTSGIRGVSYDKSRKKWQVKFRKDYKTIHFGRYDSKEEAEKVAIEKFRELFSEKII